MSTLIDSPEFSSNEIYQIAQTDAVEGAASGASFGGIGVSNEPHQQLANRTAFVKQRQDVNIANIGILQAFVADFSGSLQTNGYLQLPLNDIQRGQITALIQWGFYSLLPGTRIASDTEYSLTWPIKFPNAILIPPLATNYYNRTGGMNTVASVVSYNTTGGTFVLDIPGTVENLGAAAETSNGFSWLAIGF